jgi:hypothetical protein
VALGLDRLKKNTINLSQDNGLWIEILTRDFENMKHE